ncbi:MAG: PTS fructose transporter subunit IIA [Gammaproteobacteria bacterium]
MSVGILIIAHDGIGPSILGTTTLMMDGCPLRVKLMATTRDSGPDEMIANATEYARELDEGAGVLVLTDLIGSTPSNIARRLHEFTNIRIVSGLNLSMLIRVLNYPSLGLEELTEKAFSGGRDGIVIDKGNGD